MKNFYTLFIFCFVALGLEAQTIYKTINSNKLGGDRELKIQLPRNYNPESERKYPLIVVLDGDYLFEPVGGNIDYQAYWGDIPDCIVVGVNQNDTRNEDFYYSDDNYFPKDTGANFYEFIAAELIPYVEGNYQASSFSVIFGHDLSANFINYYLFKDNPLFRAYVVLSPDFAPEMVSRLQQRLSILKEETFYYMATADADVKVLRSSIVEADSLFKGVENKNLHYKFEEFQDGNHYSLVGRGIPKSLNEIFELYKPIDRKEYDEEILTYEGSPYDYLITKYEKIERFYGFEKELIENDIRAISTACLKKDDLDALENLSKLINKKFPDSMLSAYYSGMYYEKIGNSKKALLRYKAGLLLQPSQYIDKELMLEKVYDLQEGMND